MPQELVIILRVASYSGDDTYLSVYVSGGREHVNDTLISVVPMADGVMYALIHIRDGKADSDWGYRSKAHARRIAKSVHPGVPIIYCD